MKMIHTPYASRIFKIFFFVSVFLSSVSAFSQNDIPEEPVKNKTIDENEIYQQVEQRPEFPGGLQAFYEFIGKNYRVPKVKSLKGKVFVQFVIEKDGSVTDIKVVRDLGHGTAKEAIRVLKKSPKWTPGVQKGKNVRVMFSLPINIQT